MTDTAFPGKSGRITSALTLEVIPDGSPNRFREIRGDDFATDDIWHPGKIRQRNFSLPIGTVVTIGNEIGCKESTHEDGSLQKLPIYQMRAECDGQHVVFVLDQHDIQSGTLLN